MEQVSLRPTDELSSFHKEMNTLWKNFLGEAHFVRPIIEEWAPPVDISETEDSFIVYAELPGIETKDIDLSISGNFLTIKGRKKREESKDKHHCCAERYYGSFQRIFQLPKSVKVKTANATFNKGILKIILPKVDEVKTKIIKIDVK
ncbi:Hsp20/alpha crystallin family protein [Thermodesulfobacteriota bacterium]